MAILEERYQSEAPPEVSKEPAVRILDFINNFQIPELEISPYTDEIFSNYQLGRVFAAIIEVHGEISIRSAGYRQLTGTDGKENFIATHHPGYNYGQYGEKNVPGDVHVIVSPVGKANYIMPITISLETGVPRACKNVINKHERVELGQPMSPQQSYEQVRQLAGLMSAALKQTKTETTGFEDIG